MSPKSRGRPPGRSKRGRKKVQRAVPAVRELRLSDRALRDADRITGDVGVVDVETWASSWLGRAWEAAGLAERQPEHRLCAEVAERASSNPSSAGLAAVAALRRVAPEDDVALLDDAVNRLSEALPQPSWLNAPAATPVKAWRAVDVWDSRRVLWVEFDSAEPHTLAMWSMTTGGLFATALGQFPPGAAHTWADEIDQPTPMSLTESSTDDVLAEMAATLRHTDMTWPRQDEPTYVAWRSFAWSRCRAHLPELAWEPLPDERRTQLIDDFVATGVPDDDVTRSVADLFLDYAHGYIHSGQLNWSPFDVELLLTDWLPRKAMLDADQRTALPELLRRWVRFCLERRELELQWIEPVVAAVDENLPAFADAFDDRSSWGPAKQLAAELAGRGVDMTDSAAVDEAMRAVNAEQMARRLTEDRQK